MFIQSLFRLTSIFTTFFASHLFLFILYFFFFWDEFLCFWSTHILGLLSVKIWKAVLLWISLHFSVPDEKFSCVWNSRITFIFSQHPDNVILITLASNFAEKSLHLFKFSYIASSCLELNCVPLEVYVLISSTWRCDLICK